MPISERIKYTIVILLIVIFLAAVYFKEWHFVIFFTLLGIVSLYFVYLYWRRKWWVLLAMFFAYAGIIGGLVTQGLTSFAAEVINLAYCAIGGNDNCPPIQAQITMEKLSNVTVFFLLIIVYFLTIVMLSVIDMFVDRETGAEFRSIAGAVADPRFAAIVISAAVSITLFGETNPSKPGPKIDPEIGTGGNTSGTAGSTCDWSTIEGSQKCE